MKPILQTQLYGENAMGNGNCVAAAMASVLELPLWMVPPWEQMFGRDDWQKRRREWLAQVLGLEVVTLYASRRKPGQKKDITSDVLRAVIEKAEFHGGTFEVEGGGKRLTVTVVEG